MHGIVSMGDCVASLANIMWTAHAKSQQHKHIMYSASAASIGRCICHYELHHAHAHAYQRAMPIMQEIASMGFWSLNTAQSVYLLTRLKDKGLAAMGMYRERRVHA